MSQSPYRHERVFTRSCRLAQELLVATVGQLRKFAAFKEFRLQIRF